MRYLATHVTRYRYEQPVAQCVSEARITPREMPGQAVLETAIEIEPEAAVLDRRKDYFGNDVAAFSILQVHDRFSVQAASTVEVQPQPAGPLPDITWSDARAHLAEHPDAESLAAYEFVFDSPLVSSTEALASYAAVSLTPERPLAEAAIDLCRRIHEDFTYRPHSTSIDMPLSKIMECRQGVCQDFAHVMIGALRSHRLAARYVSGYLRSGTQMLGAEASHAWASVFLPGFGWMDLDPTNNVRPSDGHITLAWGRDYGDVTPVKGISLGGGLQTVEVEVRVVPSPAAGENAIG